MAEAFFDSDDTHLPGACPRPYGQSGDGAMMDITDADILQPRILTEEEDRAMRENLAQSDFGMSLAEFTRAWRAGEFDGNRELHGRVISLAMMLPEYWID